MVATVLIPTQNITQQDQSDIHYCCLGV